MISVTLDRDGRTWLFHQQASAPIVYLDTWALQRIALEHAEPFLGALVQRNGTLGLSWAGLIELCRARGRSAASVRTFLKRVFPSNVVFIEVEAGSVIAKENEVLAGKRQSPTMLHQELFEVYYQVERKRSLNPLDPEEFLETMSSPDDSDNRFNQFVEEARVEMERLIEGARGRAASDSTLRRRLGLPLPKGRTNFPATRFLYFEVLRHYVRTRQRLTRNHLFDMWHTVVPVAYCQHVVLDRAWAQIAREVQEKVRRRGLLPLEVEAAAIYDRVEPLLENLVL